MRNINYKYFLYARKSSESEDRQMASIEDQIAETKKLALKYNLQVVDIISESKSAKEPGRIGFNTMLDRIRNGEAQGILTWKLNRLARNPIDGGQISWMLQHSIIKHIQTFERDYNPSDNVLLMQVEFGMANQYVNDLSIDIRRGMRQKAERGWYPIPVLPLGYVHNHSYVPGNGDEILTDKSQFKILRELWLLLLTGNYSISDLKRKGDVLGLRTRSNTICSKNAYYFLFRNEFYCGYYHWRDKDGILIRYKGKHKALVSLAEFQKAQVILRARPLSISKEQKYDFPYRGIIKCGECGCTVTPDHKLQAICTSCRFKFSIKKCDKCPRCNLLLSEMNNPSIIDILYYHCNKSRGKCSQGSITKSQIDQALEKHIGTIAITNEFYQLALRLLNPTEESIREQEEKMTVLRKRISELKNRTAKLVCLRADEEINEDLFDNSMKRTEKELLLLESELENTNMSSSEVIDKKREYLDIAFEALKLFKDGDDTTKTALVRKVCSNLVLHKKKLEITTQKPILDLIVQPSLEG